MHVVPMFLGICSGHWSNLVTLFCILLPQRLARNTVMAQLTLLMAGLLFLVESEASDVADRSIFQGFLSKYMPSGSDAPRSSMSDYDKFITPNFNRVKDSVDV